MKIPFIEQIAAVQNIAPGAAVQEIAPLLTSLSLIPDGFKKLFGRIGAT